MAKVIADDKEQTQILKGIQPRHQICYKVYKTCKTVSICLIIGAVLLTILSFISVFDLFTQFKIYKYFILLILAVASVGFFIALIDKLLFLRRAPFDDWVYEIAEKRLGTSIIFYDSKNIYIQYDRGGKEVDKREFVTEMSDKSVHFSYFYVKTVIDSGIIIVQCKRRQPIPESASFTASDDKFWNIVPMGLTINNLTRKVSPIGWYLNDQNKNDELYETIPSTSILICGGTGCYGANTPILMYNSLIR